ncbi:MULTISPECIES: bifunctional 4-hydroxy-2-oxoglutarate aldolase/2-dehydro-3-deoxy-phosphogluconate aldolase [unclassified Arenibacter]|uniref:bifunctional 4-hydroxy-2-oxoglutarate aldolase/2-dehydro-3-deoxy-phosphogluconate aldolase n=1 Tax=unclassified Arenibacter TaxID=2615047 RepID=UPI000E352C13|nr:MULTISPECIES: bifunctional 4-hydroxy-2-oxoglutarate aldolase/2-dehydro-3-deoxy-phosphogluconate aldolase [unclassified Arenibacter]MCM4162466.1 2-dehydro-3-deoxyphosphogluconate aldolase [Arenibacter sp. A80]RFT58057.1 bifunctional 4-hydroxy-2-oxoglutarate aldolase/2-dehydro-3-deoxy-phosphogluconate aldolase [Arenibacter sp. P308M17]
MSNKESFSWELYKRAPIVGIVRGVSMDVMPDIARAYVGAGLHTIEITMNTPGAAEMISVLRTNFHQLNVGAGTVCNMEDYEKALAAGAQFMVTPIIDEAVIKTAVAQGIPIFPGAYSPTEIYRAWRLGASAVKIFPASQLGVQFIRDISAPLNNIKLLPTGGVSVENIKSFFEAGVVGVGMGSSLFDKRLIQERDFKGLAEHFIKIKSQIEGV